MAQLIGNYAEHVSQQTTELNFEKKRTERLLNQMLPPSVADALKKNRQVEAENYDSVTIYFRYLLMDSWCFPRKTITQTAR